MYKLIIPNSVRKDLKNLLSDVQKLIIQEYLPSIKSNPHKGLFLKGKFRQFRKYSLSYKGAEYRIVYKIEEVNKFIILIKIGSREDFYERLKHRI